MSEILVSVIVPIYNIENYIKPCVDSILSEVKSLTEVILVDDGSSDNSAKICDEISAKDARVRVIHKNNGGLSSARNAGINVAKGRYLLFVDGDDRLYGGAVDRLIKVAREYDEPDIVQFRYNEVDANGVSIHNYEYTEKMELVGDEREKYDRLYSLGGEGASACTKLIKRSLFDGLRFKEGIIHEDEYIVTDLLSASKDIVYYDRPLYLYYFRQNSIITSGFNPKKLDVFEVLERRIGILKSKGYNDLTFMEYKRMFVTISVLYTKARAADDKKSARFLKKKLGEIPNALGKKLSGGFKLKFILFKNFKITLDIIYIIKKLLKRV